MKRKFIIVGSIFVLALILLMPSIPAIEQKTIEDKAYSDFEEEIKTLDDDIKHPFLYLIIMTISSFRFFRGFILFLWGMEHYSQGDGTLCLLVALRGVWLIGTEEFMYYIFHWLSTTLNWNWWEDFA